MIDYVYLGLYRFFAFLLKILPHFLLLKLMFGISWLAYHLSKRRRDIAHSNLDVAFADRFSVEEKKDIIILAYMNLLDVTFGLMRREGMSKDEVLKNVSFEGGEIIEAYQKSAKQMIFVTGHQGNWELLAQALAIKFDIKPVGVGRKLDSALMDKVLTKNRERFNIDMVYKKGAMKGCIKALSKGKNIWLLTDQSIRKKQSIDVQFFGKNATHTPMASILSHKFDLGLIPVYIHTEDFKHYKVKVYTPINSIKTDNKEKDLATLTQAQADVMQSVIKQHPKQWFWMHKRWK
jgi:KDO2-lipid IV(A) lauroyltransferase